MRFRLILCLISTSAALCGCGQVLSALLPAAMVSATPATSVQSLPATPDVAVTQMTGVKTQLTELGETVQDTGSTAAGHLETFGNSVIGATQYVGGKVEGLGNLVLEATGGSPTKP